MDGKVKHVTVCARVRVCVFERQQIALTLTFNGILVNRGTIQIQKDLYGDAAAHEEIWHHCLHPGVRLPDSVAQGVTNVLKHFKEAHYLKEERNQPESGYQQHMCAYIENNEVLCLYQLLAFVAHQTEKTINDTMAPT